jgi:hypothetical protein
MGREYTLRAGEKTFRDRSLFVSAVTSEIWTHPETM